MSIPLLRRMMNMSFENLFSIAMPHLQVSHRNQAPCLGSLKFTALSVSIYTYFKDFPSPGKAVRCTLLTPMSGLEVCICCLQGLELDAHGRVVLFSSHTNSWLHHFVRDQEQWAAQTDKNFSEWVENVGVIGGRAMTEAGMICL